MTVHRLNIKRADKLILKKYYEREGPESIRLYDFRVPFHFYYDKKRREAVLRLMRNGATPDGSVLDVGCGDGSYLCHANCNYAVGLDISRSKLQHAKENLKRKHIYDLVAADAEHLPFRNSSLHVVLASELIEHVPDPVRTIREIMRVCKEKVVISTPTQTSLFRLLFFRLLGTRKYGHTHIREFSQRELLRLLEENGLRPIVLRATPLLDFPWVRSMLIAKLLFFLDHQVEKWIPPLRSYGVFSCVACLKHHSSTVMEAEEQT